MNLKQIEKELDLFPNESDLKLLNNRADEIIEFLENDLKKESVKADVFVGGSFAKVTILKSDIYEIDVFVRFDWKYENVSEILERVLNKNISKKYELEKIHGSRDYFRLKIAKNLVIEIIPVTKIKNPKEARNVTDLSYFHVNYVRKKIRKDGNLAKEIVLAKLFCKANNVYGAESYIQGFSGYAIECLIINYESFAKMAKEIVNAKDRIIIDIEKQYKRKDDVLFELNGARLKSPIILIDPIFKERNALASLSQETFDKFKQALISFNKKPDKKYFEIKEFDVNNIKNYAKKNKASLVKIILTTNKQPGDIAGTKMRKFSEMLIKEVSSYYKILKYEFNYGKEDSAELYIVGNSKKEIIEIGPYTNLEEHCKSFKKRHKNVYSKNGRLYARIKVSSNMKDYLNYWIKINKNKIKEMDITGIRIN